jgi:hypothetical protein
MMIDIFEYIYDKHELLAIIQNVYREIVNNMSSCISRKHFPVMFSLFIEYLELYLQNNLNSGINLQDICAILLCFLLMIWY